MGAKRPDIDWIEVRALYMADQLPIRAIARRYGISNAAIIARAKKEGWSKELSRRVATGVKEAVITSCLPKSRGKQLSDKHKAGKQEQVVRAAIEEGRLLVLSHIARGKLLGDNGERLGKIIQAKIEAMEGDPTAADSGELFTLARSHESIVRAMANTVAIERQARGLDDMPADPNAPPSISITYYRSDLVLKNNQNSSVEQPAIEIKKVN